MREGETAMLNFAIRRRGSNVSLLMRISVHIALFSVHRKPRAEDL